MLSDFFKRSSRWIIEQLDDIDFYKFTMGQIIFLQDPDTVVTFKLINRTKSVRLADHVDINELRAQLDHVRTLRFTKAALHHLRGTNEYKERMFREEYLQFLEGLQMPEYKLSVNKRTGQFDLTFTCRWCEVTYWETLALSIINELYFESIIANYTPMEMDAFYAEGIKRLKAKIDRLKKYPRLTFCDFGTRRRLSREWQKYVVAMLKAELAHTQFLGTSNEWLARVIDLLAMGTSAHEIPMVMAAKETEDEAIRNSHRAGLLNWWKLYGFGLSIALTDTFGTNFFFRDFTPEMARKWKGLRHDSGDPFEFGEAAIKFYESHKIDPRQKMLVFSDGLDIDKMIELFERFDGRIRVTFGWGTTLTNDLGLQTLSLVIKVIAASGQWAAKLSDNLNKATGDRRTVRRYAKIFAYHNHWREECRV